MYHTHRYQCIINMFPIYIINSGYHKHQLIRRESPKVVQRTRKEGWNTKSAGCPVLNKQTDNYATHNAICYNMKFD